ncbi:MAG: hypothetical protein HYX27_24345 [Acidobacteria bacterium]|nr:hypothetical protein [Acidobacteriota bacterium]
MNVVLYLVCIVLMLPVIGFATFGLVIDSLTQFGLWEVIKILFAPLYDPLGKGIWLILVLAGSAGLIGAGFFPESRTYGFWTIAAATLACIAYILKVYPGPWEFGNILIFIPSLAGIGLSVYCALKPAQ